MKRLPNESDLGRLAQALELFGVEYVVIGGTAMALHGFPRMTKDIDLLLPVDAGNNQRLLDALASIPDNASGLPQLKREWLDQGFSTALEADINIDLLFVAASQTFDALRQHIQSVSFQGVAVQTLDVDGLLLTKQTDRESDIPDRTRLRRLREALRAADKPQKD